MTRDQTPASTEDDDHEFISAKMEDGRTVVVARSRVWWVKAQHDFLWFHTKNGEKCLTRGTLKSLEQHWAKHGFVRIHKSYLAFLPRARELRLGGWGWVLTVGASAMALRSFQ
jgi:DNA-binding LytR/AlgR family response regulator